MNSKPRCPNLTYNVGVLVCRLTNKKCPLYSGDTDMCEWYEAFLKEALKEIGD